MVVPRTFSGKASKTRRGRRTLELASVLLAAAKCFRCSKSRQQATSKDRSVNCALSPQRCLAQSRVAR
eukprot:3207436-Amphidinium_carterae.2